MINISNDFAALRKKYEEDKTRKEQEELDKVLKRMNDTVAAKAMSRRYHIPIKGSVNDDKAVEQK